MSDAQATECIQSDKIDILVDLAGHTANNRLLLFAQKPVPIQVNWIGYPATSGLSAMDYRIVDRYTDPPGLTEQFYSEVLMRLPESFICYLPEICSPEVDRLPALFTGHITFGSFNNVNKMSPEVSEAWIDILKAVENSHFVIKSKGLNIPKVRDNIMKVFRQGGISDQRITLLAELPSTREHLDVYNSIDISLDTFPYNGTTTTCESLWMGVPVITLTGTAYAARVGTSILSNVGLPELIAGTADEYKSIAVNLAGDPERLQSLRGNLRTLMTRSPLCNAERFTANVEICYRKMWENWCTACR
jgi:predicted O-linked N-acetylglucosamine transferase (SPINDLY family)